MRRAVGAKHFTHKHKTNDVCVLPRALSKRSQHTFGILPPSCVVDQARLDSTQNLFLCLFFFFVLKHQITHQKETYFAGKELGNDQDTLARFKVRKDPAGPTQHSAGDFNGNYNQHNHHEKCACKASTTIAVGNCKVSALSLHTKKTHTDPFDAAVILHSETFPKSLTSCMIKAH